MDTLQAQMAKSDPQQAVQMVQVFTHNKQRYEQVLDKAEGLEKRLMQAPKRWCQYEEE